MDISQFNKILGDKIRKANVFERQSQFKDAIKLWVEISEMILGASKDTTLNVVYRSMLIKKTEQIVAHVKELKSTIAMSEDYIRPMERLKGESSIEQEIDSPSVITTDQVDTTYKGSKSSPTIIEDSDIANLPIGIKEIKTSKDFKILTPHDPSIVQKRLDEADKMDEFFDNVAKKSSLPSLEKRPTEPSTTIKLEQFSEDGNLVCFACGTENPKNSEKCKDCGTKFS